MVQEFKLKHGRYTPLLGRSFFARQLSRATGTARRIIGRGLTADAPAEASLTAVESSALPETKRKPNYMMYAGIGLAGALLLALAGRRTRTA